MALKDFFFADPIKIGMKTISDADLIKSLQDSERSTENKEFVTTSSSFAKTIGFLIMEDPNLEDQGARSNSSIKKWRHESILKHDASAVVDADGAND